MKIVGRRTYSLVALYTALPALLPLAGIVEAFSLEDLLKHGVLGGAIAALRAARR